MSDIEQLLRDRNIRPTPIRTGILSLLKQSRRAYTNADLERAFDYSLDRVSLYRSLLTLMEANLIQKHIDARGVCSYFYVPSNETSTPTDQIRASASADNPFFKCSHCETVVPLPKLPDEYLALVRQYQLNNLRLMAEGTCDECRQHPAP